MSCACTMQSRRPMWEHWKARGWADWAGAPSLHTGCASYLSVYAVVICQNICILQCLYLKHQRSLLLIRPVPYAKLPQSQAHMAYND